MTTPVHSLRVTSVRAETRDAVVVTLEVPDAQREDFRFTAGQHLTLLAHVNEQEIRRSYSICSAPFEQQISVAIKRVQDGLFSTWANRELRAGHTIECLRASGSFGVAMQPAIARHHVAFVAGSGITPVFSILKTVLHEEPNSRFTLVYGNRSSTSVMFREELESLKNEHMDRLRLVFILSREQQDIDLFNGRIDGEKTSRLLQHWIDPRDIDIAYICGPRDMMDAVSTTLLERGVPQDAIRKELFGTATPTPRNSAGTQAGAGTSSVLIIQDGRERQLQVARGAQTLLDAALEQGVELPYSCKGGVCSTCRCKLTEGEVEMDVHFALEDYEVARGFILTCQSYPLTDRLTLDFDQES